MTPLRLFLLLLTLLCSHHDAVVSGFPVSMSAHNKQPRASSSICNRRHAIQSTLASSAFILTTTPTPSHAAYIDSDTLKITNRVYLDIEIGDDSATKNRIVIGLYGDKMPRTVKNFVTLCQDNAYADTTFYRVLSNYTIQGGAIGDETGKTSTTPSPFEPDNYDILHDKAGLVSMVRGVGGSVDSRFFINIPENAGWADDRYAAFGIVEEGMEFITDKIEKVPVQQPQNRPKVPVKIVASGVL